MTHDAVIDWLCAVDPALHWQALRDLCDAPPAEWQAVRAQVETQGWGARLLSFQDADGQWAGGAFVPAGFTQAQWRSEGQPWTATCFALQQLRLFGLDPACASARRTVALIGANARWDHADERYWDGEVEECINGRTVADGAYFGVDVGPTVQRLLGEQQTEGGWNCERCNGSDRASFHSTINVLEGLLAFERATGGSNATRQARAAGEAFLLRRGLFRRLTTGEPADTAFLAFRQPWRWQYDVLRALDYFCDAGLFGGTPPDGRLGDAIDWLKSRRLPDGRWPLDRTDTGRVWFVAGDVVGEPSPWITLRALRVLRWWGR